MATTKQHHHVAGALRHLFKPATIHIVNPCTDADIQQLLEEEAATEQSSGWKTVSKSEFTEVSRKATQDEKLHLVKALFHFPNIAVDDVTELCTNAELRMQWDTHFVHIEVVEQFDDYCCMYWQFKMPLGLTNRDLLQYMWLKKDESTNTTYIVFKAATHPKVPEKKDFVRAHTVLSGLIVRPDPNDPNSTRATLLVKTDARGMIPKAAVNYASEKGMDKWRAELVKYYTDVYSKK